MAHHTEGLEIVDGILTTKMDRLDVIQLKRGLQELVTPLASPLSVCSDIFQNGFGNALAFQHAGRFNKGLFVKLRNRFDHIAGCAHS